MERKLRLTGSLLLIVVLGVVTAFDAMAIDMYLPAFADIGQALDADAGVTQTSLSIFLAGLAARPDPLCLSRDDGRCRPLIGSATGWN